MPWVFLAIGFTGGVLGGLVGVGGGFIMVPLQVFFAKLPLRRASGTSLLAVLPIAIAGVLVYYFGGREVAVNLRFALLLMAGSVLGAYIGARFVSQLPEPPLRIAVAVLLFLVGVKEVLLP